MIVIIDIFIFILGTNSKHVKHCKICICGLLILPKNYLY